MQTRKIFNFLEVAGKMAISRRDGRSFYHGAIGIRNDGTMVSSVNGSTGVPNKNGHAEARLANKLDHGATVYVARISACDGKLNNSKPCFNCERVLRSRGVKRVYYSISEHEYGILDLQKKEKYNGV